MLPTTIMSSRRHFSKRSLTQYGLFAIIFVIVYRIFSGGNQKAPDEDTVSIKELGSNHPKNVRMQHGRTMDELDKEWGGVKEDDQEPFQKVMKGEQVKEERVNLRDRRDPVDSLVEEAGEMGANDGSRKREVNLGDIPKPKDDPHDNVDDIFMKNARHQFMMGNAQEQAGVADDDEDHLTELQKRREIYLERVETRAEMFENDEYKNMHEDETEYFPFVTAASHTTYPATLEFIYSIQYFYPKSQISIYDIGLFEDEKDFINSLCNVKVETMWLHLWPEDMYKNRHRTWRPTLLQFAAGKYTHFVYVEPGRYINKQRLKDYIKHSKRNGVTIVGSQQKYTTFSVTHPTMYTFLPVEEKMIKKYPHFNFNIIILHNTKRVKQHFMRYLLSCTQEEYCIAPPGSKSGCDGTLERSRRWANCHRYDESAMNIILNTWHNYNSDEYLMKDAITKHYDGKDVTRKLKVCTQQVNKDKNEM